MEKLTNELEFDEFEKLLGEIPNATSVTTNSEESGLINFSKDLKRVSLDDKIQQSHMRRVQQEEPNLPDDQTLTSAFAELSFSEGAMTEAARSPLINFKSFHNHPVLSNGHYSNGFKKLPSDVDPQAMFVACTQSQNNLSTTFEKLGAKKGFQESSNSLKLGAQEFKKPSVGYYQPIENFSGTLPFTHGVPGYHFLSNVPLHGVELPIFSDQRQYFMDSQPQLPYLHSEQLSQPHVTWRTMEEEKYYRMQKQHLYMQQQQQLGSQRLETQHPIRANGNLVARLMSHNLRQPCNEPPISNQEAMWNNSTVSRSLHLSNLALSSANLNKMQVLDKVGKQSFPEKILTRSYGLNSLRSVKFGSFAGNELLASVNQNGRIFSNGHCPQHLSNPNAAFQLENVSLGGLSADTADLKHNYSRPLLQYNSIDEIAGRMYFAAKDQYGCRFLQRKFTEGTKEDIKKIFVEIIVHIVELMTDPFGNYLVQKLLEVCDEDQLMQIVGAITRKCGDLVRISCDMHGTRAVQKVIETLKTPEQCTMVVSSLKPGIVHVIKNTNGNHVAQRCLQHLMPEYCELHGNSSFIGSSSLNTKTSFHRVWTCLGTCEETHNLISALHIANILRFRV
ncbi:hypothetical protein U1Q18_032005 [Sarracenia purpurea var. burkii]